MRIEHENIVTIKRDYITLKELDHPSICKYKALYIEKSSRVAYLVMEYVPYPPLDRKSIES